MSIGQVKKEWLIFLSAVLVVVVGCFLVYRSDTPLLQDRSSTEEITVSETETKPNAKYEFINKFPETYYRQTKFSSTLNPVSTNTESYATELTISPDGLVLMHEDEKQQERMLVVYETDPNPDEIWTVLSATPWCHDGERSLYTVEECHAADRYIIEANIALLERPDGSQVNYTVIYHMPGSACYTIGKPTLFNGYTQLPHKIDARWWVIAPSGWTPENGLCKDSDSYVGPFAPLVWN